MRWWDRVVVPRLKWYIAIAVLASPFGYRPHIDYALQHYVKSFLADAKRHHAYHGDITFDMRIGKMPPNANLSHIGTCFAYVTIFDTILPKEIIIKDESWAYMSEAAKHTLIDHELIHCYLSLDHVPRDGELMSPQMDTRMGWYAYFQMSDKFWSGWREYHANIF